jgi:hypothetical protein
MREKEEKTRQGDERGRVTELYLEQFDLSWAVEPRNKHRRESLFRLRWPRARNGPSEGESFRQADRGE